MYHHSILFLLFLLLFTACASSSLEDFREEGRQTSAALVHELRYVRTTEDLRLARPKLKELFDALADAMIRSKEWVRRHPGVELIELEPRDRYLSDSLQAELWCIYKLEAGREIIEDCQKEALYRLDAYEKAS